VKDLIGVIITAAIDSGYPDLFLGMMSLGASAFLVLALQVALDRFDFWGSLPI
jgi:hypothetical protein